MGGASQRPDRSQWVEPTEYKQLGELCDWLSGSEVPIWGDAAVKKLEGEIQKVQGRPGTEAKTARMKMPLGETLLRRMP